MNVLLLGATGYIGGSALVAIKKVHPELHIHALIRKESQVAVVKAAGANEVTVNASNDHAVVRRLVAESDFVVESADGFDVSLAQDLIEGLRTRKQKTGTPGTLFHVSGSTSFIDLNKEGKLEPNTKIWTDDESDLRQITTEVPRGAFDIPLLQASDAGDFNLFILNPPVIYGEGLGPVSRLSPFYLLMLSGYEGGAKPVYFGEGSNVWSFIHLRDVLTAFEIVFEQAYSAAEKGVILPGSAYSRYFIASTSKMTGKEIATRFATVLHNKGVASSVEPANVPVNTEGTDLLSRAAGSNMILESKKLLPLGWKPTTTRVDEAEFAKGIETALEAYQARMH